MNRLSETHIYNSIDSHFGGSYKSLTNAVTNLDYSKYAVPMEMYEDYVAMFKGYKYPLAKLTYENSKKESAKVKPLMFHDPYNKHDVPFDKFIPQQMFTFLKNEQGKGLVCYVDTALRGNYRRSTVGEKEPTLYNIKPLHLYAYMQFGTVRRLCQMKDEQISRSTALLQQLADFYSFLLAKIMDKFYSVAAIRDDYEILQFLCNCFFLENMAKMPKEKAIQMTMSNKRFTKFQSMISGRCNYVQSNSPFNMFNKHTDRDEYPIHEFIRVCQDQFRQMEDKLTVRTLGFQYLQAYTQNAVFCMEDFGSFLIMLQSAYLKLGLFNDLTVSNVLGSALSNFLVSLDDVLSK